MHRQFLKVRDTFPKSADEHAQQVARLLQHRRAELNAAWEELEVGWKANNERMAEVGLRPRTAEEGMIKLNVGGSNVTVFWNLLVETEGFRDSVPFALLEGVWDKEGIPRDADGRILLDESPACIKHIMHAMLNGGESSVAEGQPEIAQRSAVAMDEVPCLMYTAYVMGLPGSVPAHPRYVQITGGGSTVLEPLEIAPFSAKVREWVGGSTEHIALIYRATRDGFGSKAFKAKCNKRSRNTISLIRVRSGQENDDDSVVGGFSVSPWGGMLGSQSVVASQSFVFMLKDGGATGSDICKPTRWHPASACVDTSIVLTRTDGPCFGSGDLATIFDKKSGVCTLETGREIFDIGEDSLFLTLNGKTVVDIEVYRCSSLAPEITAPSTTEPRANALADAEAHDMRSFGESIATSLMEERVVLDRAVREKEAVGAKICAAVGALETVYGPTVAAGKQDTVVELNVRGTRMTTLRSTLQACPRSALATMFDDENWPGTDKDKDEHWGRLIDCDPTCFSKILDVLRMRKRASWGRRVTPVKQEEESSGKWTCAVLIKKADLKAFRLAVHTYFPGCESFIMGLCGVSTTPSTW